MDKKERAMLLRKKLEKMSNEELYEKQKELQNKIDKNNSDIKKYTKKILAIKEKIKELEEFIKEKKELSERNIDHLKENKEKLEIYLYFKKVTEENHEIYAVSSENELMTKEIIPIKYENISMTVRELYCFIEYLKNLNALQKQEELKVVKVSKLYVDNLFIVNNWTNGVVKENQNEVIKELIPVATALRKEFEELGGELIYIKPKENIAKIYYKENIEE